MFFPWQMVPRYHPQINIWDILCALAQGAKDLKFPLEDLGLKIEEDRLFRLNSATSGLHVMLKALKLSAGSGIGVPPYTCITVFEAIASAGLRCVFVDIDPETFSFDLESLKQKREQMGAVIMIHTFGFPGDISAVKQIMEDKPIIEDCSHALGSTYTNLPVGLNGAAGVFSFNFYKPISVGGGGLLIVNDRKYVTSVRDILEQLPAPRDWLCPKSTLKHICRAALYRAPWYGMLAASGLLALRRDGRLAAQVKAEQMSRFILKLLKRKIFNQFRFENQRIWARELSELAGNPSPVHTFVSKGQLWNGYLLPILLETPVQREDSLDYFHKNGVDAYLLWSECLKTASRFGYQSGQCPLFEDAFKRLLMLPCYAELTDSQRKRVRKAVQNWRLNFC